MSHAALGTRVSHRSVTAFASRHAQLNPTYESPYVILAIISAPPPGA